MPPTTNRSVRTAWAKDERQYSVLYIQYNIQYTQAFWENNSMMTNNSYSVTSFTATIDVKRNIFDLCTDTKDCYLAVIEVRTVFISAR